ncbi:MAG: hypothetical protein OEY57_13750 [Nitrospirota bacterium]|nr:hypothetical protein [Nitrospirota bacterium]
MKSEKTQLIWWVCLVKVAMTGILDFNNTCQDFQSPFQNIGMVRRSLLDC